MTCVADSRKRSIYDHGLTTEGGIFSNDFFYAGPGAYTASISKDGDENDGEHECEDHDGIRIVRELRMVSDSMAPSPRLLACDADAGAERDIELGLVSGSGSGSGSGAGAGAGAGAGPGQQTLTPSIEWDLGDFEFPVYKERMNAPI